MTGLNGSGESAETKVADKTTTTLPPIATFDPALLPAKVTERVESEGDLINLKELTPEQIAQAKGIAEKFNLGNTTSVLTFAAAPQKAVSGFLDSLIADITVEEAGVAGDIAKQLAAGIDLMALDKVKQQISSPWSSSFIGRIMYRFKLWTNYIRNFYYSKQSILKLIEQIERKANNRMQALDTHSKKLDGLAQSSSKQVRELATWILAGEIILLGARKQYLERREQVLQSKDPLAAAELHDMRRQLAAFETRLLKAQIAYVKASSVTIPRVRSVQESIKIEIQNISEQILFQVPDFKAAVVIIAALHATKLARDDRMVMDENQRKLEDVLEDAVQETQRFAKESQGDPLKIVQDLQQTVGKVKAGIEQATQIEIATSGQRKEAKKLLVELKDVIADAIKQTDFVSAEAAV